MRKRLLVFTVLAGAALVAPGIRAWQSGATGTTAAGPDDRLAAYERHLAMERASPYGSIDWTFLGPTNVGGRANDVAVADRNGQRTIYVAFAGGGVWKNDEELSGWQPVFTRAASTATTAVAVAPSNPDIIWVGTGHGLRAHVPLAGAGVFKSTDAGRTWQPMGLVNAGSIGRIAIDPRRPDIVYVAATGRADPRYDTGGVFRTTDGGKTWARVFSAGPDVGAFNLVMDPGDSNTFYVTTTGRQARFESSRVLSLDQQLRPSVFRTTDAGRTWKEMTDGLPPPNLRARIIGIDIARSRPSILFAVVRNAEIIAQASPGQTNAFGLQAADQQKGAELYRTDDRGGTWRRITQAPGVSIEPGTGWPQQVRVDPRDPDTLYLLGVSLKVSHDGGRTFRPVSGPHADHNGMWIDPRSGTAYDCNDGGLAILDDGGAGWKLAPAPTTQIYGVALDTASPFRAYGAVQDDASYSAIVELGDGRSVVGPVAFEIAPGGEATTHAVAPDDPNVVFATGNYTGTNATRVVFADTGARNKVIKPTVPQGDPAVRGTWATPLATSPHDPNVVYIGYQYLFRSPNRGDRWERISPDLSDNGPQTSRRPDNFNQAIAAISESPRKAGLIYAGTDDGHLHVTMNGGKTWTELTAGLPHREWVSGVVASAFTEGTVYVTQRGRLSDDFAPYLYRSTDYGQTWTSLVGNIPAGTINVVREDPANPDVLFSGTDFGVYISTTRGERWDVLGGEFPSVPVTDLQIQPRDRVIVVSTYGRGLWALDATRIGKAAANAGQRTAPVDRSPGVASAAARRPPAATGGGRSAAETVTKPIVVAGSFRAKMLDAAWESGSPDGSLVLYHRDGAPGRLYGRDLASGAERMVLDLNGTVSNIVWAPDSAQFAYTLTPSRAGRAAGPQPPGEVRIAAMATGESRPLGTPGTARSWNADGTILVSRPSRVGAGRDLWFVSAAGAKPRLVANSRGVQSAVLLPGSTSMMTVGPSGRLAVLSASTSAKRTVTVGNAEEMPLVSPDGRLLTFASNRDGRWGLYVAPLDRLPIRDVVRIADLDAAPTADAAWWTNDGTLVLRPTYEATLIYRLDVDAATGRAIGAPRRLLSAGDSYPDSFSVSPDGRRIAFIGYPDDADGNSATLIVDANGAPISRINGPDGPIGWLSPDELVLAPYDKCGGDCAFATFDLRTGKRMALMALPWDARVSATYVPSRREIVYYVGSNAAGMPLKAYSVADRSERTVAVIDYLSGVQVSSDGRRIAYAHYMSPPTPGAQRTAEMGLMTIDGRTERTLLKTSAFPAAWSPDGRFLMYFDADGTPQVMNVDNGDTRPLVAGDGQPDWSWGIYSASWAPQGSFVVMSGHDTWKAPQTLAWEGVTYEAVMKLLAGGRTTKGR